MSTKTRFSLVAVTAALATFAAACGHEQAELAEPTSAALTVSVSPVELILEQRMIEVRGTAQPARQAFVSSRVVGPVVAVHVAAGEAVRRGQPLVEIQAQASDGQLAQTKGALAQAQAGLALTEKNFRRFEALHGENAASDLELDAARMQLEQAQGAVSQAEGAVQAARAVAEETVVRAPFSGRVAQVPVEIGDLAAPGRPLVQVESTHGSEIWLTVRESDIGRVALGQTLDVRFDSLPKMGSITGTVAEIVPFADPATHTFTVKVSLTADGIRSGISGRASLPGDPVERLIVPSGAVHRRGGLELVVVRAGDGTARTRAVTTGRVLDGGRIEILSGLNEGEMVALGTAGPVADGTLLEVRR